MDRYEVGIKACKAGVIPAGKLSVEAATVKLMVDLAKKIRAIKRQNKKKEKLNLNSISPFLYDY